MDDGGKDGYLVQCNACFTRVRPGFPGEKYVWRDFIFGDLGFDASLRHERAFKLVEKLLGRNKRIGVNDVVSMAGDLVDPGARLLAREITRRRILEREILRHFKGTMGKGSRLASLVMLVQKELARRSPGSERFFHTAGGLERMLSGLPDEILRKAAKAALTQWNRLGSPRWGSIHGSRPGTLDTLLACGGSPWDGPPFPSSLGSFLPMVVSFANGKPRINLVMERGIKKISI